MADQFEEILLEKLDNDGKRTGYYEKYPRVSAEIMLNLPNTRWALPEETVKEKPTKAKGDAGS